jgi:hypothetical protein
MHMTEELIARMKHPICITMHSPAIGESGGVRGVGKGRRSLCHEKYAQVMNFHHVL